MISNNRLLSMIRLQEAMNYKVHPNWRGQGFKWSRAIMVEAVEALDHYGWKWWKKNEPNLPQVKLELVDIWHFILSDYQQNYQRQDDVLCVLVKDLSIGAPAYLVEGDTRKTFEVLIASAAVGQINLPAFLALMQQVGLSWDELYSTYIAKNVLNMFRQEHGYADGTYIKVWDGLEDNVVLEKLLVMRPDATPAELRDKLSSVYAQLSAPA